MVRQVALVAVLTVALLLGGTGCMFKTGNESQSTNYNDAALNYMETKYGEKFEYVAPFGASYASKYTKLIVKSESMADEILVAVDKSGDAYSYSDNYLAVKYKSEMLSTIQEEAKKTFENPLVFYEVLMQTLSPDLSPEASFEEYSKDAKSGIVATIVVSAVAFEESKVKVFSEGFHELGINAQFRFVALNNEQRTSIDEIGISDVIGLKKYEYYAVITIGSSGIDIDPQEEA